MGFGMILLVLLLLAFAGVVPAWPHARGWGYGPSGIVGTLLLVLVVLFVMGRVWGRLPRRARTPFVRF